MNVKDALLKNIERFPYGITYGELRNAVDNLINHYNLPNDITKELEELIKEQKIVEIIIHKKTYYPANSITIKIRSGEDGFSMNL